jgi:hypothetical protein
MEVDITTRPEGGRYVRCDFHDSWYVGGRLVLG